MSLKNAEAIKERAEARMNELSQSVLEAEKELSRAYWELRFKAGEEYANKCAASLMSSPF